MIYLILKIFYPFRVVFNHKKQVLVMISISITCYQSLQTIIYICLQMEIKLIKLKIQKERRALGFSQEYMAHTLGMSPNSYRQIETGKTKLVSPRIFDIARVLKTTPEELLLGVAPIEKDNGKAEGLEKSYLEKISMIETENRISIVEYEGEIQRLKAALESKDSIIGVLKENLHRYNK